jgi:hypothetical protein
MLMSKQEKMVSELMDKTMMIADFKNSSPFVIRVLTYVPGVYVQRSAETEDGSTEYAAGGDMYIPDLVFVRSLTKGVRVIKYVPGAWEKALDGLFFKVQSLKTALETRDKESFLASLREGLDIEDEDVFRVNGEAGFKELVGR